MQMVNLPLGVVIVYNIMAKRVDTCKTLHLINMKQIHLKNEDAQIRTWE